MSVGQVVAKKLLSECDQGFELCLGPQGRGLVMARDDAAAFAIKAGYVVVAVLALVFVSMLLLTVLHP